MVAELLSWLERTRIYQLRTWSQWQPARQSLQSCQHQDQQQALLYQPMAKWALHGWRHYLRRPVGMRKEKLPGP